MSRPAISRYVLVRVSVAIGPGAHVVRVQMKPEATHWSELPVLRVVHVPRCGELPQTEEEAAGAAIAALREAYPTLS